MIYVLNWTEQNNQTRAHIFSLHRVLPNGLLQSEVQIPKSVTLQIYNVWLCSCRMNLEIEVESKGIRVINPRYGVCTK